MRVLIVGAGAIGSLVGHGLARAGHEVILVGRQPYVAAVRRRGLGFEDAGRVTRTTAENGRRTSRANVRVVTSALDVADEPFDLAPMQKQFTRSLWLVSEDRSEFVTGDIHFV